MSLCSPMVQNGSAAKAQTVSEPAPDYQAAGSAFYTSGSSLRTIFSFTKLILVTALHFGQNRGKFTNVVSSWTLVLVFPLHTGHGSQYSFCFACDMTFSLFHHGSASCVRPCGFLYSNTKNNSIFGHSLSHCFRFFPRFRSNKDLYSCL